MPEAQPKATDAAASMIPSGTATFLFTDIEGSAERWERHRDAMQAALARRCGRRPLRYPPGNMTRA